MIAETKISVWEWCKNVWYSNRQQLDRTAVAVWEWCKNVWYSNEEVSTGTSQGFENDVKMYGTQTEFSKIMASRIVWEWCKNVWYSNRKAEDGNYIIVWEWCKNVWYSNYAEEITVKLPVWEWCKNVWYSNNFSSIEDINSFENDVKMYGTQTFASSSFASFSLRMM